MSDDALARTHEALNDLLGFVEYAWPEIREYLIFLHCMGVLEKNCKIIPHAPISGNLVKYLSNDDPWEVP